MPKVHCKDCWFYALRAKRCRQWNVPADHYDSCGDGMSDEGGTHGRETNNVDVGACDDVYPSRLVRLY